MSCTHTSEKSYWVDEFENDWGYTEPGHWEYTTVSTTEDIDTGRYRCTKCGEVMYYTGTWRKHWEGS